MFFVFFFRSVLFVLGKYYLRHFIKKKTTKKNKSVYFIIVYISFPFPFNLAELSISLFLSLSCSRYFFLFLIWVFLDQSSWSNFDEETIYLHARFDFKKKTLKATNKLTKREREEG